VIGTFARRVGLRAIAPIRSYQPTRLHQALVLIALVFVLSPWLIPIAMLLTLSIAAIIYFSLGPDRVAELVVAGHERLSRHNPDLAERARLRAVAWSARLVRLVHFLPARWVQGLYLPDFENPVQAHEKMQVDPFERLAAQVRNS
jgi:hypothetical protein